MDKKSLDQYLLVSTFDKLLMTEDFSFLDKLTKKDYLKQPITSPSNSLPYYTYLDAIIGIKNEANTKKQIDLINHILQTSEYDLIKEHKSSVSLEEYIMTFLNYLYFEIYFGTEKATNPKKIKSFLKNEKLLEIQQFQSNITSKLGLDNPISYKINRIVEIINEFDYNSIENFIAQLDKIVEYIDRILKNLLSLDAIPYVFILKHLYLPYKALVYRVNGDKTSKEAEYFNFLTNKANLSLSSYKTLYAFLEEIKIPETDFSYLKVVTNSCCADFKVNNLAKLSELISHIVIDAANDKLQVDDKQILYLLYKDIELLTLEYLILIEFLNK